MPNATQGTYAGLFAAIVAISAFAPAHAVDVRKCETMLMKIVPSRAQMSEQSWQRLLKEEVPFKTQEELFQYLDKRRVTMCNATDDPYFRRECLVSGDEQRAINKERGRHGAQAVHEAVISLAKSRCLATTVQFWTEMKPSQIEPLMAHINRDSIAAEKAAAESARAAKIEAENRATRQQAAEEERRAAASRPATVQREESSPSVDDYMNERIKQKRCETLYSRLSRALGSSNPNAREQARAQLRSAGC